MKRKFRYNHKTKKWDEVFTIRNEIVVVTPFIGPDGMYQTFRVPQYSPLFCKITGEKQ